MSIGKTKTARVDTTATKMLCGRGERIAELRFEHRLFIDGEWRESAAGQSFDVCDPSTGNVVAALPLASAVETANAVQSAVDAFPAWSRCSALERADMLRRLADLIARHQEPLAQLAVLEQGMPLEQSRAGVAYAGSFFRWFAEEARRVYGYSVPHPDPHRRLHVEYFPRGVAGIITPWNAPLASPAKKVAAALAAGCTVVLKPSELTPLSALALAWLMSEVGIPPGVFNVVCGDPVAIGKVLLEHPQVRMISFTGSCKTGRYLYTEAAKQIKHVCLELGGNAPFIVFEDANLDQAVDDLIKLKTANSGQICVTANRVLVEASIYQEFAERVLKNYGQLSVGDGFTVGVEQGPLITSDAADRVDHLVQEAQGDGAETLCGGRRLEVGPNFYPPTILTKLPPKARLLNEEIFGPVLPLVPFHSEAEAIAVANATDFRLAAYAYTTNWNRAWRISGELEFGVIGLNDPRPLTCEAPFGGTSQSGIGREGGREGLAEFLESKLIGSRM